MSRATLMTALTRAVAFGAMLAVTIPVLTVSANGVPVSIVLSYQSGLSNYGPANATGVAELVPREGETRVTVTGLPRLTGEQYVVWITNSGTTDRMALGAFNTSDNGIGKLELTATEPFPDKGWDTVYISAENAGPLPNQPGARRSIAGKWPVPGTQQGRPNALPNTGGPIPDSAASSGIPVSSVIAGVVVAVLVSGVAGFGIGRARERRRPS